MPPPLHKRVKRAVRSAFLRAVISVLSLIPLRAALALGALVGRLGWSLAPGNRRLVLEGLAAAFPEKPEEERCAIGCASMVHLGQVAAEVVTLRQYAKRIEAYVSMEPTGEARVRAAMARGQGMICCAGHIGNWELMAQRLSIITQPNAVIAKLNADGWMNRAISALRAEGGVKTLWREDPNTGRELIRIFRKGGALGILIDQDTKVQGVFVPFFGKLAFTPRAIGDLALRFGATVLVITCHRRGPDPGDGHELDVVEVPYDPSPVDEEAESVRITAACVAAQEAAIRRAPSEWVWMHRRWKTRPESERA